MYKQPILLLLCWLGCWVMTMAWAKDLEPLLQADEAFQLSGELKDAQTVRLSWDIAEGYYLYRQKFAFVSASRDIKLGVPSFPAGQTKQDQHFGNVEIYRDQLEVELPIQRSAANPASLKLEVSFQGCADAGVCYMPVKKSITLDLSD